MAVCGGWVVILYVTFFFHTFRNMWLMYHHPDPLAIIIIIIIIIFPHHHNNSVLAGALHTAGLLGMDALYATRAAQILQHILHTFHVLAGGALEHACRDLVQATGAPVCEGYPVGGLDAYTNATAAAHKEGQAGALVNDMAALGQCLLLRKVG